MTRFAMLVLILAATACGGASDDSPKTPAERAKARLIELFEVVEQGDAKAAAEFFVYRKSGSERRWKDVYHADNEEDMQTVLRAIADVKAKMGEGEPRFIKFESETESEGTWLVWHVSWGEAEDAKQLAFACLEIDGKIALGDID